MKMAGIMKTKYQGDGRVYAYYINLHNGYWIPIECCFSFLVSTDVTNLFRQRFHKPCADENVSSAISCLHISLPSLPRASTLVGLGDVLPRPRCRGCFFYLMGELLCFFVASTKLPRNFPSAVLPHPSARAATRTFSPCYDSTNTTEDK